MVKRRRKLRQRRTTHTGSKRTSRSRKKKSVKERFYTSAIWALGLINLVLITSKLSEFFVSPNETSISAGPAVVAEEQLASSNPTPIDVERQVKKKTKVEVLNACGVQGLANKYTEFLRGKGFDVLNVGNYEGGFGLTRTMVLDRVSLGKENALKIGEALGVDRKQIQAQLDDSRKLEVTVLLGRDYKKLESYPDIR